MSNRKTKLSVQYMTRIAILGALSAILFMIEIPVVAFYKLDVSTLPALLGAFSMGPWAGLAILAIKDVFGLLHSGTMYVGELADFIMGAAYILPAALIYRFRKTRKNALIGVIAGTVAMIIVSVRPHDFEGSRASRPSSRMLMTSGLFLFCSKIGTEFPCMTDPTAPALSVLPPFCSGAVGSSSGMFSNCSQSSIYSRDSSISGMTNSDSRETMGICSSPCRRRMVESTMPPAIRKISKSTMPMISRIFARRESCSRYCFSGRVWDVVSLIALFGTPFDVLMVFSIPHVCEYGINGIETVCHFIVKKRECRTAIAAAFP